GMSKLVLVIDDEAPIRDLVTALLLEEGWQTRDYGSALEALRHIETGIVRPDLVLLDMRMPEMDGPQFADALRAHDASIPIVVMTAARDARQWAEAIDAAGYLPKPFDIEWVIDTVTEVIGEPDTHTDTDNGITKCVPSRSAPGIRVALGRWVAPAWQQAAAG